MTDKMNSTANSEKEAEDLRQLRKKYFGVFADYIDPDGWNTPTIQMCGYTVRISLPTFLGKIRDFPVDENDVFIASFPKSGTTFMQHIVWLLMTRDFDTKQPIDERVVELDLPLPYPVKPENLDAIAKQMPPRLFKTHLALKFLPKDVFKGRVIYIYRNAKDVTVSYYHHAQAILTISYKDSFEKFVDMFIRGKVNFGPWSRHVLDYYSEALNDKNDRILLIAYEDLKKDRLGSIKKIAKFLGKDNLPEEIFQRIFEATSFEAMRANEAVNFDWVRKMGYRDPEKEPFIRKGVVGDWRNYFTEELSAKLDAHVRETFAASGLTFVYDQTENLENSVAGPLLEITHGKEKEGDEERKEVQRKYFGVFADFVDPDGWCTPTIQICGYTERMWLPILLEKIRNFPVDEKDVFVTGFPKSGTTFTQHIVWLIMTQDFDTTQSIDERFIELDLPPPFPITAENLDTVAKQPPPRFLRSHIALRFLPKDVFKGRVIYVYRNPKDVIVSYYHHAKAMLTISYKKSFEKFVEMFIQGKVNFAPWTNHVLEFYNEAVNRHNDRLLLVAFENLKKDRLGQIKRIAKFLGKEDLTEEAFQRIFEATSFEKMRSNEAVNFDSDGARDHNKEPFIRKGAVGDWKNYFTEELSAKLDANVREVFAGSGLTFVYDNESC